jgi:hypothetical protein
MRLPAVVAVVLTAALASPAPAQKARRDRVKRGIVVAKLAALDRVVERREEGRDEWRRLAEGDPVRTGDRVRTAPQGFARLDFPWMRVTLGPGSVLAVPAAFVLSTALEQGRAEFAGEGPDIVKIQVAEVEVRGGGRLVLRREAGVTAASALEGRFRIAAAGQSVTIEAGEGTAVADGQTPSPPSPLPPAPKGLFPGADPVYVVSGRAVDLHWEPSGTGHHVEVLELGSDEVLLARESVVPPVRVEIPWLGTYRWRVSAREGRGVESRPSADGFVCVVER